MIGIGLGLGMTRGGGGGFFPDFYVDSVNGSDSNDGLTALTPFATLGKTQTEALAFGNGVKIGLARGSYWRELLNLTTISGARVQGYGDLTDPLPCITAANIANNADFSLAPAQTKTYLITWAHAVPLTIGKHKLRVWENNVPLKWVSSIANCEAEAGTFHVRNDAIVSPALIYVHPVGDTNPTTNGKTYEITSRSASIILGSGSYAKDLHTTKNAFHDGSFIGGVNGYQENVLSTQGVVHNQWVSTGGTAKNCVAYKCEPSSWRSLNATLFVTFNSNSGSGATYDGCYAYSDSPVGNAHEGIYAHTSGGANRLTRLTVRNCYTYGPTPYISTSDTDTLSISDSFMEFLPGRSTEAKGIGASGGTTLVDNITAINCARLFEFASNLTATDVRAYINADVSGGVFWKTGANITQSTFVFLNTVPTRILFNSTGNAATFGGNVVQNGTFSTIATANSASITSDGNVIWTQASAINSFRVQDIATSYSFANWRTQTGEDANTAYLVSQGTNLVTDPANNDFTFTNSVVDTGRTAGSRRSIARPDWAALTAAWDAGFLGIDGTGL